MSAPNPCSLERRLKQGRSAVTNGKRTLIGVNTSRKYGRRYRDLIALYEAEIDGKLTASQSAMVRQAAALAIRSEMMQAEIVNGQPVEVDDVIRLSSEFRRNLEAITAKPVPSQRSSESDLSRYIAAKAAIG